MKKDIYLSTMKIIKIHFCLLFIGLSILLTSSISAQSVSSLKQNVTKVKSSQVSDAQLQVIMQRAIEAGLTPDQIESLARSRGMSEDQIEKFKLRSERLFDNKTMKNGDGLRINTRPSVDYPDSFDERFFFIQEINNEPNFGFSLFRNSDLSFEPSFNIATPQNYLIGPGDLLNIDVWGASQHSYQEVVSNEGNVIISNIGPVDLSGLSIEEADKKLKSILSKIYSGIKDGNTFIKVTLGAVRNIQINIVGEVVLPGTYNLSSLATVFNAMYVAGGPSENGSLRDVQIIRNNKVIAKVDFYDYLLRGRQTNNKRLQDQDIVFVSPYSNRVSIKGKVKREKQFDIKLSESLEDLIYFAGGFTGDAYTERVKIFRKTGKENRVLDISAKYLDAINLQNGDEIMIDSVLARFENRVFISGAVFRPGVYAIDSVSTLKQLIKKADGLREDVFKNRISIFRLRDDLSRENITIDLNELLKSNLDFTLKREDSIRISSIYDLREEYVIHIEGEVHFPGVYSYAENTFVEDLIMQAGGLLETASSANVEVSRRVGNSTSLSTENKLAEIIKFSINKSLKLDEKASGFRLQPFDQVFIRRSPAYIPQMNVSIEGEVNFPGKYSIRSRTERISDLIMRAGDITTEAYLKGASLIRKQTSDKAITNRAIKNIANEKESSNKVIVSRDKFDVIGVDLADILRNPGGVNDLYLQEGDSIRILKHSQTIKVSGSVYNPNVIPYQKGLNLRDYIYNAGGFTKGSKPGHIYVVYANGSVKKTKRTLFFRGFPELEPGAEIIVPNKGEKRRMSMAESIGISSAAASMALLLVTLINAL